LRVIDFKDVKGSGSGLIYNNILKFPYSDLENPKQTSVIIILGEEYKS
jgi:hypothetical protein